MAAINSQSLRLRRPEVTKDVKAPPKSRHSGMLQDQLRRTARPPWTPSLSLAFRLLLLLRFSAAMYSNIQDCDEVYNFWEPLHYLDKGVGFQTWEVSPQYAIRSWAYVVLHFLPAWGPTRLLSLGKRQAFFFVRIFLAVICSFCEAKFYRTIVESLNGRVGRYTLFMLIFNAGMWNASTAFLPSSFAMYTNLLAFSYAYQIPSRMNNRRTLLATFLFAAGAIVGWPFSLLVAVPFVFEELFISGLDRVASTGHGAWQYGRFKRLVLSGCVAAALFAPVIFIDSTAYGRLVVVPWNIVKYNIFGGSERGPELYGSEPWHFYFLNLLLNFNILEPLALASLPSLVVTYYVDRKRLGIQAPNPDQSSPFTLLAIRLSPLYLWIGVLTSQAHKEERFMYPIYPLVCFNAAVTLYLARGWLERAYITITKSPYKASQSSIFRLMTFTIILVSITASVSRILALSHYYHAPLDIAFHFESIELPRLLNVTGLLVTPPLDPGESDSDATPRIDLTPIEQFELRLCFGKEWYRFPSHYLVPDGIDVRFVKSNFDGLLPRRFDASGGHNRFWKREATRNVPPGLNDLNKEERSHHVDVSTCDYLVDLDFPDNPAATPSVHEPRYSIDSKNWDRVVCFPFLDASHSPVLTRTLWVPNPLWSQRNSYGDYCLLRHRQRAEKRENVEL